MFREFKEFALRGNVIDLAVGIIIGAAFTTVVNSLVEDIIMPPIGLITGGFNFENLFWIIGEPANPSGPLMTPELAEAAGAVTINYGQFITSIITFLLTALAVFLLVRSINTLYVQKKEDEAKSEPVVKECPYCVKEIPSNATRCPFCTSHLEGAAAALNEQRAGTFG